MPTSLKSPIIYDKECRNGYFVGNGIYRYCREYGNGPGILVGSTKRRRSQQELISEEHMQSTKGNKVISHYFSGNINQLVQRIMSLGQNYHQSILSEERINNDIKEFLKMANHQSVKGDRHCLGDICITKWKIIDNNFINCQLKVRY